MELACVREDAADGSDMFIPADGKGLELRRVAVNDGRDGSVIIVAKDAADHLPKEVLNRLVFYGLDGSRGREAAVKAGDVLLAINSKILSNADPMHQDAMLCNEPHRRTFVLLRDTKQQMVRGDAEAQRRAQDSEGGCGGRT
jgi:hypothetical protein